MDSKTIVSAPPRRVVGGSILALVVGALLPLVAVLQITMLAPVLMLGGIFAVYLKARSGWAPAATLIGAALISTGYFLGVQIALLVLTAAMLPGLYTMRGVALKQPFFEQLNAGVIAFVTGLIAAVLIAYASFGGAMVARFADVLRTEFALMPDAALQPLVDAINSTLGASVTGFEAFTVQSYRASLSGIVDLMQQTYAQNLPGALLSGAVLSGVLAVLWGNWTMARQGMATNESFVGMSGWFLPARVSLGAVALWLAGLILTLSSYSGGTTAYQTICQLVGAGFAVQALAAMDRRMLAAGRSVTRRRVLITILAVVALLAPGIGSMLGYVGAASALFGSRGAVKLWLQQRQDDHSDHDDPDE